MRRPRFLLIGIGGVYNYGCEAIVRGTESILRREFPDAEIIYASRRPADDRRRLAGCQVRVTDRGKHRRYSLRNICRKALSTIGVTWHPTSDPSSLLQNVDAVFSIGGDLYTLSATGGYSMSFAKFGDLAQRCGVPCILWGASVGPFTKNPAAEKAYKEHLKRLSLITARESATVEYLQALGVSDNVVACADPAYVVASERKAGSLPQGNAFTIGVNFSPLSARHACLNTGEAIDVQAKMIERIIRAHGARVVLIPHVVCDFDPGDDDLRYLRSLRRSLSPDCQHAVTLLEHVPGFVAVKKQLAKLDLVIAARMHCAINALAARIPTILVAYSQKALGMAEYVYGNRNWVVTIEEHAQVGLLEGKVTAMREQNIEIRQYLTARMPMIQRDAHRPLQRLRALLEAAQSCVPGGTCINEQQTHFAEQTASVHKRQRSIACNLH